MTNLLVDVGNAACWGAVALVWVAGALYNVFHAPQERTRSRSVSTVQIGAAVVCAMLVIFSRAYWNDVAVGAPWVRVLGLVLVVASTVFALWARFSLGTMWSMAPSVTGDHHLRTRGPYAVTRHPIYTGLLGMLLGTTLLSGIGQCIVLFPVGLILFEVKIRMEERLMLATFSDEYPRYRRQVPQLVPGLYALHRRHSVSASPDASDEGARDCPPGISLT